MHSLSTVNSMDWFREVYFACATTTLLFAFLARFFEFLFQHSYSIFQNRYFCTSFNALLKFIVANYRIPLTRNDLPADIFPGPTNFCCFLLTFFHFHPFFCSYRKNSSENVSIEIHFLTPTSMTVPNPSMTVHMIWCVHSMVSVGLINQFASILICA